MTNETKHSALPWVSEKTEGEDDRYIICHTETTCDQTGVCEIESQADAEFICRSANNYYAMLEALELAYLYMQQARPAVYDQIRQAIKAARGEPE